MRQEASWLIALMLGEEDLWQAKMRHEQRVLEWHDDANGGWLKRASRSVGGRYQIRAARVRGTPAAEEQKNFLKQGQIARRGDCGSTNALGGVLVTVTKTREAVFSSWRRLPYAHDALLARQK